ncbi:peptidoglycan-binding protein [Clostridium sp. WILCCON 0269]|uniref:Peptidoglycan-binding protein n=1 Tax=Candidatus Clostridium eludens TaxID=3381663 RepID=A0ABW8SLZ1_9CLOT
MKNAKEFLMIAAITAGITLSGKSVHAQQTSTSQIKEQPSYNLDVNFITTQKQNYNKKIIKNIQSTLNLYFGAGLAEDGIYGKLTTESVKNVQKILGVNVDGIFGAVTANALLNYIDNNYPKLNNDGYSPVPTYIQEKLLLLGYNIKVNGDLSSMDTVTALKDFQNKNCLPITGKVDINLVDKLNEKTKENTDETVNFSSHTSYYILVNSEDHICKIYEKSENKWTQTRCFNIFSGKINNGTYGLGIHGEHINFNGIEMKNFVQIDGLNVFYSAASDSGYGIRVSKEDAEFLSSLPSGTTIKIF